MHSGDVQWRELSDTDYTAAWQSKHDTPERQLVIEERAGCGDGSRYTVKQQPLHPGDGFTVIDTHDDVEDAYATALAYRLQS